jgi:hypothetical protein
MAARFTSKQGAYLSFISHYAKLCVHRRARWSLRGPREHALSYHDAPKKRWQIAAAWKAVISDGLVAEWRVYCDTAWARPAQ